MLRQLKYYFQPVEIIIMIFAAMHSPLAVWIVFIILDTFVILGDFLFKDDSSDLNVKSPFLLNFSLYLHFPLLIVLIYFSMILIQFHADSLLDYIGISLMLGLTIGSAAVNVGHDTSNQKSN